MSDVQGAMCPNEVIAKWLRKSARSGRPIKISSALALRLAAELSPITFDANGQIQNPFHEKSHV